MTLRSTLPDSGPSPSSSPLRRWSARVALVLSIALISAVGLPSAYAQPGIRVVPGHDDYLDEIPIAPDQVIKAQQELNE